MFNRWPALLFLSAILLRAQMPLENSGKPMRVAYECTAADTQAVGLGCSEEDPCPVYLELENVDAIGNGIFVTGNLHTPMATLYSIVLASVDEGKTWTEPHPRLRSSGLDQIQFLDAQNCRCPPFQSGNVTGSRTWRCGSVETQVPRSARASSMARWKVG